MLDCRTLRWKGRRRGETETAYEGESGEKETTFECLYPLDATVEFLQDNPKQPTSMSYARYEKYKASKDNRRGFSTGRYSMVISSTTLHVDTANFEDEE